MTQKSSKVMQIDDELSTLRLSSEEVLEASSPPLLASSLHRVSLAPPTSQTPYLHLVWRPDKQCEFMVKINPVSFISKDGDRRGFDKFKIYNESSVPCQPFLLHRHLLLPFCHCSYGMYRLFEKSRCTVFYKK